MLARSAVSGSVAAAARRLEGAVPAAAVAWELFELHPEYGGKSSSTTRLSEGPDSVRRTVDEWLAEVRRLVDESAVPELHGRIVIVGLALLDDDLRGRLEAGGTFSAIVAELREPLEKVLTKEGLSRLDSWVAAASTATTSAAHEASSPSAEPPRALAEAVPTHTDNPATIDALKR